MEFLDRIKKEMSEGIVRAFLENHNYRVIDTGIEKVIREVSCLPQDLYLQLGFPKVISKLPDFTVMDVNQTKKVFVDVKYRSQWNPEIIESVRDQVELFKEVTLIIVNGNPPEPTGNLAEHKSSAYIRCLDLRYKNEKYEVHVRYPNGKFWIDATKTDSLKWWVTESLYDCFSSKFTDNKIDKDDTASLLDTAVQAINGIVNTKNKDIEPKKNGLNF